MTLAYFDCVSGAAGDMICAALIDAGADADELRSRIAELGIDGYDIEVSRVNKQGFAATYFNVRLDQSTKQPHRHLRHVVEILSDGDLSPRVRDRSIQVFTRLAEAEAAVHGTTIEKVHFHEVGGIDAIVDVVGATTALDMLGVSRVVCSPIPTGSGTVRCEHGVMPVPAPATANLLCGVPLAASPESGELTTPTGAAILTTLAEEFGGLPNMRLARVGYGAGTRDGRTVPNVLRVFLGERDEAGDVDEIVVLETNLDDVPGEVVGHTLERLLDAGALDAYLVPIQVKKSRPGVILTVLADRQNVQTLEQVIFRETGTLGIRRHSTQRSKLFRRLETVATPFGEIRMKIATGDELVTASPEYEDCRRAALEHGVPLRSVMEAAMTQWRRQTG